MSLVAPTLQSFFTDRLVNQRRAAGRRLVTRRGPLDPCDQCGESG